MPVSYPGGMIEHVFGGDVADGELIEVMGEATRDESIDHTVPFPVGPTHPSNLKAFCRTHHLIKTFCTGPVRWSDRQLPDGTVVLTAPTGHLYATEPHGGSFVSGGGYFDRGPGLTVAGAGVAG
jgi:hypothetical protein